MSVSPFHAQQRLPVLKGLLARQNTASKEQGLTLIECLVAVFVIGLTVTLITPPLFIAAATRAQNRRAEQALQIAQGEVDRIRTMVARGNHTNADLPKEIPNGIALKDYGTPNGFVGSLIKTPSSACTGRYDDRAIDPTKALKVDVDGDCVADFFMQVFRTRGNTTQDQRTSTPTVTQQRPSDFQLGVRVYSIVADGTAPGNAWGNLESPPQQASLQMTNGQGNQRRRPLAIIYTPFSWSDQNSTLCSYFQNANGALPQGCPPP
ncbi:MAG: type II secretion system GspH family protein [Drouetiella hepatica Uher 2000/2452]|uniref:Type II secretion system GspH family protein n=1 Tax=Drouetiella hepatica Uher 2000/2452 TaxID=904376 RepID=A0A951QFA8_9CYAN|nr:type II secretion system GspH family protein [Drouetiella hepatica Uher 2000/2452]